MKRNMDSAGSSKDTASVVDALMREHESALLRYACRFLNDNHAAQDVVQETFIRLFRFLDNGSHPGDAIKGWLYRVTHNNAVDHIRRESRRRVAYLKKRENDEVDAGQPVEGVSAVYSARERNELVLQKLNRLKPEERQVLILRLQEGKSYREISDITGRSEGNVGCLLHHATRKMADELKRAGAL